ncbi:Clavaminate synthase-like protein [Lentinula detonsa]|uniref:Clavaminate synthase-like protein n=1 Tax=Lentinula detonsa TaxID=2804962 RepID=A0AA38Q7K8_9AGAR|nr:Clavaminate synthase-like protein [Lentinula detonsa]
MTMTVTPTHYSSIPTLDYSKSQRPGPERDAFLASLRDILINIGFLYLSNHSVAMDTVNKVIAYAPKFFALPQEIKDSVDFTRSPAFLGYFNVGGQRVVHARSGTEGPSPISETREQFTFAADRDPKLVDGYPEWAKQDGTGLWPADEVIPGFKAALVDYYQQVEQLSYDFAALIAESLGLNPAAFEQWFDKDRNKMQPRVKLMRYPPPTDPSNPKETGIDSHEDRGFLTFLLQASSVAGLEVRNISGEWLPCPPVDGTFVVNLGRALEKVTRGVCMATSHRVLSPPGPEVRYSVPFFSNVSMYVRLADADPQFPQEVWDMYQARQQKLGRPVEWVFSNMDKQLAGLTRLTYKVKNHPEMGMKYHPVFFKEVFPNGPPPQSSKVKGVMA